MLSFIYDFLQMIVPAVSTFLSAFRSAFGAIVNVVPWLSEFVSGCGFPPAVLSLFALIIGLAFIDKILEVVT